MVRVKICGITNEEDALAAVEAGADALGFNFYRRSPRYVSPQAARRIVERVPERVLCVGVFVNEEAEEVRRVVTEAGLGAAQLHGDETADYCRGLMCGMTIKALRVGEGFDIGRVAQAGADAVLLDAFSGEAFGGTGRTFDWDLARRACELVPKLFLAGGLTPSNVADAVRAVRPFAVDVCSGVESAPGRKSPALVKDFIASARGGE
ncbi:MAG TPA: phosphoribosylanthranilate isomerase [Pyrinomonadaceae bacterium]|nr:phosphoribosylanthranilate isomerase [Pyrinomonadaceae bacterium]